MARAAIDRDRIPRADPEDQSNIPDHLLNLSFRMAMFLRYDAARIHNLEDGWLHVDTILDDLSRSHPTETWKDTDVLKVVETSFTKDKPRFEASERSDGYRVRAAPRSGLQDLGWQKSWGSSSGRRSQDKRHRHPGWEYGNARPFSAKASVGTFDGVWGRSGDDDHVCDIRRTMLKWKDYEQMVKIKLNGSKILVPDGTSGHMTQGTLSADKQRITFDDGDQWVRQQTELEVEVVETDSHSGDTWQQHRVLADWDATDDEYLSLRQGEHILVKLELEDGWAFGKSITGGKSGYFPPTFAQRESGT